MPGVIGADGWVRHCIWEHSRSLRELYERRCRGAEPEMTCAAQAAGLLAPRVRPGEVLLDVGCGSGYFYHSIRRRALPVEYHGIDAAPSLIEIGRRILPTFGLHPDHLRVLRIEDLDGRVDHTVCLNVLSNLDNYHRPLERLLECTARTVVLRESVCDAGEYRYVTDRYLDEGCELKVHVNTYPLGELTDFIEGYGFDVTVVTDERTGGQPELVIDHPHHWTFLVAERR